MTPSEWLILAAAIATPVGSALVIWSRIVYRLGRQDAQLEWQSRVLEQAAQKSGSTPPPREKLTTLQDPFETILTEARAKKRAEE